MCFAHPLLTICDHAQAVEQALRSGLEVYSCKDVQSVYNEVKVLKKGFKTHLGEGFIVQPIPLFHNVECIGFLIEHEEFGKLLFCTDTEKIPYKFKDVHHILVECNNDYETMIDNMCNNEQYTSASQNHMNSEDTLEFLKKNYNANLQNVVLLHASKANMNGVKIIEDFKKQLCFDNIFLGVAGLEIELNKTEF